MSLAETRSHFILFTDFTDFATRLLGYGLAALSGLRHLLDGLDSLDGSDGRERLASERAENGFAQTGSGRAEVNIPLSALTES